VREGIGVYIQVRYRDGAVIGYRPVFYNGKRWHDSVVRSAERPFGGPDKHYVSVFESSAARYPRAYPVRKGV
jgi:hypothetical protein